MPLLLVAMHLLWPKNRLPNLEGIASGPPANATTVRLCVGASRSRADLPRAMLQKCNNMHWLPFEETAEGLE